MPLLYRISYLRHPTPSLLEFASLTAFQNSPSLLHLPLQLVNSFHLLPLAYRSLPAYKIPNLGLGLDFLSSLLDLFSVQKIFFPPSRSKHFIPCKSTYLLPPLLDTPFSPDGRPNRDGLTRQALSPKPSVSDRLSELLKKSTHSSHANQIYSKSAPTRLILQYAYHPPDF